MTTPETEPKPVAPHYDVDDAPEVENILPPEQAPMDDAAGGPQAEDPNAPVDNDTNGTSTDDLTVQGGE